MFNKTKSFIVPEFSEKVISKWNHIKTAGQTIPGQREHFDTNNLPEWWDSNKITSTQATIKRDLER